MTRKLSADQIRQQRAVSTTTARLRKLLWDDNLKPHAGLNLLPLEARLIAAIARDVPGPVMDGWGRGGDFDDGARATDGTSTVEATVIGLVDADRDELAKRYADEVHDLVTAAVGDFLEAARGLTNAIDKLKTLDRVSDPDPIDRKGIAQCAEPWCEDLIQVGREGRCEPCYRWRYRWRQDHPGAQPPAVPAKVIDERNARRGYIDGPNQGQIAG